MRQSYAVPLGAPVVRLLQDLWNITRRRSRRKADIRNTLNAALRRPRLSLVRFLERCLSAQGARERHFRCVARFCGGGAIKRTAPNANLCNQSPFQYKQK